MFGVDPQSDRPAVGALSEEQKALVRDNLGLVAVHLRRFVPRDRRPHHRAEWRDLFQEGCLGLINAAISFDPGRNIAFPAYALPRIHHAVSLALRRGSTMIAIPRHPPKKRRARQQHAQRSDPYTPPRVRNFASESGPYGLRARQNRPADPPGETVGDRLRDKYDRAVRSAGEAAARTRHARDDRRELVRKLVEDRLLVPQEEARKSMRQVARETGSSYARVAQCEKKLLDETRRTLDGDPEFAELRRLARHDPIGVHAIVDESIDRGLAERSAEEFMRQYRSAQPDQRMAMLSTLLEVAPRNMDDLMRKQLAGLPAHLRERVLGSVPRPS